VGRDRGSQELVDKGPEREDSTHSAVSDDGDLRVALGRHQAEGIGHAHRRFHGADVDVIREDAPDIMKWAWTCELFGHSRGNQISDDACGDKILPSNLMVSLPAGVLSAE
jgi:hypothetical protein